MKLGKTPPFAPQAMFTNASIDAFSDSGVKYLNKPAGAQSYSASMLTGK